jgi:hypothetical protein
MRQCKLPVLGAFDDHRHSLRPIPMLQLQREVESRLVIHLKIGVLAGEARQIHVPITLCRTDGILMISKVRLWLAGIVKFACQAEVRLSTQLE